MFWIRHFQLQEIRDFLAAERGFAEIQQRICGIGRGNYGISSHWCIIKRRHKFISAVLKYWRRQTIGFHFAPDGVDARVTVSDSILAKGEGKVKCQSNAEKIEFENQNKT